MLNLPLIKSANPYNIDNLDAINARAAIYRATR
jgi:hypothetical protein